VKILFVGTALVAMPVAVGILASAHLFAPQSTAS